MSDAGGSGGGKWLDASTQIRSIFRDMLRIQHAADGRLPLQGAPGGVFQTGSKCILRCTHIFLRCTQWCGPFKFYRVDQ